VTVDRDAIDLTGAHASLSDVMAAVLGIQGSVSANGHRLRAVGVTWSAGSEPKARELVTNLTEFGLTNIVTVRPAEATSSLTHNAPRGEGAARAVDLGEVGGAAADGGVPLARGAALTLARTATVESEHDESPRRERRWPDPSGIAAATIICGATLGAMAVMWMGVGPRHTDSDVAPPAPQQRSSPPARSTSRTGRRARRRRPRPYPGKIPLRTTRKARRRSRRRVPSSPRRRVQNRHRRVRDRRVRDRRQTTRALRRAMGPRTDALRRLITERPFDYWALITGRRSRP
jgi:hypothetical protein